MKAKNDAAKKTNDALKRLDKLPKTIDNAFALVEEIGRVSPNAYEENVRRELLFFVFSCIEESSFDERDRDRNIEKIFRTLGKRTVEFIMRNEWEWILDSPFRECFSSLVSGYGYALEENRVKEFLNKLGNRLETTGLEEEVDESVFDAFFSLHKFGMLDIGEIDEFFSRIAEKNPHLFSRVATYFSKAVADLAPDESRHCLTNALEIDAYIGCRSSASFHPRKFLFYIPLFQREERKRFEDDVVGLVSENAMLAEPLSASPVNIENVRPEVMESMMEKHMRNRNAKGLAELLSLKPVLSRRLFDSAFEFLASSPEFPALSHIFLNLPQTTKTQARRAFWSSIEFLKKAAANEPTQPSESDAVFEVFRSLFDSSSKKAAGLKNNLTKDEFFEVLSATAPGSRSKPVFLSYKTVFDCFTEDAILGGLERLLESTATEGRGSVAECFALFACVEDLSSPENSSPFFGRDNTKRALALSENAMFHTVSAPFSGLLSGALLDGPRERLAFRKFFLEICEYRNSALVAAATPAFWEFLTKTYPEKDLEKLMSVAAVMTAACEEDAGDIPPL